MKSVKSKLRHFGGPGCFIWKIRMLDQKSGLQITNWFAPGPIINKLVCTYGKRSWFACIENKSCFAPIENQRLMLKIKSCPHDCMDMLAAWQL